MRSILDIPRLGSVPDAPFPPTSEALASPNGLLAWGGCLRPQRLLNAYSRGIFPWYSDGQPILWWSPAPRCVLFPERVYLSKRTRRRYNSGDFTLSMDQAFAEVVEGCAAPRSYDSETWITDDMKMAYCSLHEQALAHSLEVWKEEQLVGGIYGIAIGSIFFGESMFGNETDASKIALVALCRLLHDAEFTMLDCQVGNAHLFRMGAVELTREVFERDLGRAIAIEPDHQWYRNPAFDSRW